MIFSGRLAQLVRAPALQAGGHRFESYSAHHFYAGIAQLVEQLTCKIEYNSKFILHLYREIYKVDVANSGNPSQTGVIICIVCIAKSHYFIIKSIVTILVRQIINMKNILINGGLEELMDLKENIKCLIT